MFHLMLEIYFVNRKNISIHSKYVNINTCLLSQADNVKIKQDLSHGNFVHIHGRHYVN
jgi:hypothetical protein